MPRPSTTRRALAAVVGGATLAACGSSDPAPSPTPVQGNAKAACTNAGTIIRQLDSISTDLAASKLLFRRLAGESRTLAATAPPSLRADATDLKAAIATTQTYIDRAQSIEQLQTFEQRPAVQDAFNRLLTAGSHLGDWRKQHC